MTSSRLPASVLFCCTLNAIRSPMAEGALKKLHGTEIYVDSAGSQGTDAPDGFMIEVMREIGIDMSRHHPKSFARLHDGSFDLIIALSPEAHAHAREITRATATEVRFWETADPSLAEGSRERRLNAYRETRDQLIRRIQAAFPPVAA